MVLRKDKGDINKWMDNFVYNMMFLVLVGCFLKFIEIFIVGIVVW